MLEFLMKNWGTIFIGVVVLAVVLGIIVKLIRDKRKGASACGCGCENCPSSRMCHKQ